MIAEAIKEARPDYRSILVDLQTIRWTNPRTKKRYVCITPVAAAQALVKFDQGAEIEPFAITLKPAQITPSKPGSRGRRELKKHHEGPVIAGGDPLPAGHLRGTDGSGSESAERSREKREQTRIATGGESNVELSGSRYRQYGLRLLRS
jgi:hypothetical protein